MNVTLDRRITIEQRVQGQDDTFGAATYAWTVFATVWAERVDALPSRSESTLQQGLDVGRGACRYRLRWLQGLDSAMRIREGSVAYAIVGGPAEIGGRRAYMEVTCEHYTSEGGNA